MPAVIPGDQIKEIVHLIQHTTHSNAKIAEVVGVTRVTVGNYRKKVISLGVSSSLLDHLDELETQQFFHPNYPYRQSKKAPISFDEVSAVIKKNKGKKGTENISHYHEENVKEHGKDADCRSGYYKKIKDHFKNNKDDICLPQYYYPGEVLFTDFVGPTEKYGPNDEFTANFIASCFGYSKYLGYEVTDYQKTYDWCSHIQSRFKQANGVTIRVVHDNTKALVTTPKTRNQNLKLNKVYQLMARWFKFKPCPTPVYSPTFNALAENAVKIFENEILPKLRKRKFDTKEELNAYIAKLTDKINRRKLTGENRSRHDKFYGEEVPAMLPYPEKDFPFPLKVRDIKVPKTWNFKQDGVAYPIPRTPGVTKVTLLIHQDEVEVKSGTKSLVVHKRLKPGEIHKIDPAHLDEKYQQYYIEDKAYFVEWARKLSPSVVTLVEAQFNGVSTPDYSGREECLMIQELCIEGKEKAFIDACDFVEVYGQLSFEDLESVLNSNAAHVKTGLRCMDMFDQIERDEMNNQGDNYVH
ncbi:MAG: hypothetical protein MK214_15720 [Thalassotalea sp.]|nr:hypothetical protein [Thalassotalea sp.]